MYLDLQVYVSSVEVTNRTGRPLGRWEDRVQEYVRGNGLEWARRVCMDKERWRSVCCGHPLGGCFQRKQGVRAID